MAVQARARSYHPATGLIRSVDDEERLKTFHTFCKVGVPKVILRNEGLWYDPSAVKIRGREMNYLAKLERRLRTVFRPRRRPTSVSDFWAEKYYKEVMELSNLDKIAANAEDDLIKLKQDGIVDYLMGQLRQAKGSLNTHE